MTGDLLSEVKALTLTNSRCSAKSDNQTKSKDYKNYIIGNYRENGIY